MTLKILPSRRTGTVGLDEVVVPRRHPWRWLLAGLLLLLVVMIVEGLATNPAMRWDVVGDYLFAEPVLEGLLMTLRITVLAMLIGIVLGGILAVMRLSGNPVLLAVSLGYSALFRSIPVLVQLLFWFFLSAVLPKIGLGVPFGPVFVEAETNSLISRFGAALLGLGLAEAAYMAEIIRAGLLSVPRGQSEAAAALGMPPGKALRRIVLPQAMRFIVPPTGNQAISMLKMTSLVIAISLPDLLTSVQTIYARNFLQIPLLTVACFWYLVMTGVLSVGQYFLERRFGKGAST
ncbi:amino acid ABC transporter permease [Phytohabitans sp. ZYX-F-186]|uniref:Amino acid ABC transporter permease n=1 Tax=Phytohabitans maris TaxID=3071409 RepID=A0ABU0ZE20_9ACTN|nr:amino acid ABC transporter permease [Phytohabitans sp. ZYX-F-186]MDQ7905198.1 amino acid ABC transporter permease [Phytohabitans sp. ZYX-F-186]